MVCPSLSWTGERTEVERPRAPCRRPQMVCYPSSRPPDLVFICSIKPNSVNLSPDIGPEDFVAGQALLKKTYAGVQNNEVRDMLRTYFSDFSALTWAVVFGYSLAGTTKTGIFMEENTQLILAASITSSGATRQARSHLKASLGLGHSMATVRNVHQVASTLADWNGTAIAPLDVAQIAAEVKEALATAESQKSVA